jgi:hypothetical protein
MLGNWRFRPEPSFFHFKDVAFKNSSENDPSIIKTTGGMLCFSKASVDRRNDLMWQGCFVR